MKISENIQPYLRYYPVRKAYLAYVNYMHQKQSRGRYTLYYFNGWRLLGINCP